MDMITLAMAKAYTDDKVGSGPVVIDFDALGITQQLFAGGDTAGASFTADKVWLE